VAASVALAIVLNCWLGSFTGSVMFFLAGILIDFDHLVSYHYLTKNWTWNLLVEYQHMYKWWAGTHFKYDQWLFLHKFEPFLIVVMFAPLPWNLIGYGVLTHFFLDCIQYPQRLKHMSLIMNI
jgi:hypothetical protein